MRKLMAMIMTIGLCPSAFAQMGHYEFIPYYGNNPFVFCKLGVPEDCWVPTDPQRGKYRVIDRKCFKSYSAKMYERVCSKGGMSAATPASRSAMRDPADASPGL
ncbi:MULTISPECIES: hypothetical protein [unclassified Luteibacter]|uniref:hypothetical protein n=1 Tax=unclassified Luteibacter TaxID=2620188 RepID=UPI0008B9D10E|nr:MULTISPECIES: hypothetical protein [unclassified Luteibacter]MDR6935004.1 hypothetical protein [Luteibacter sp. 3190]SEW00492.1 hypothetical protein SAMN04515660_1703 [Luteibacter sp. 329MFSha]